jgi:nucleoside 2-deoxyribosyltransferase
MDKEGRTEIYFACSIRGGRDDAETYAQIFENTRTQATVLTEIFADGKLTSAGMNKPSREIWDIDMAWVRQADAVIAEVTNPSLGVGYEIAKAEEWGKPVLALFREDNEKKLSAMVAGSPNTETFRYMQLDEAFVAINSFITNIRSR